MYLRLCFIYVAQLGWRHYVSCIVTLGQKSSADAATPHDVFKKWHVKTDGAMYFLDLGNTNLQRLV